MILAGLKLPPGDINSNSMFMLSSACSYPGILEESLSHLGGLLLKFLYGSLVDATTFVHQMASGDGLEVTCL